ncbi:Uncharacterised protein [Segatella oris]|uniref:Uncharacterized protein n=1 Tax=Segatella oris TaxID=28135 RepID=A0A448L2F9_9BACT|nr:Uncharacterised protein [Segatella oris]
MNKSLLDRVSVEKIDALVDALSGVISDMRITGENSEACFCNEAYWACYSLRNMMFTSLRHREQNRLGE